MIADITVLSVFQSVYSLFSGHRILHPSEVDIPRIFSPTCLSMKRSCGECIEQAAECEALDVTCRSDQD